MAVNDRRCSVMYGGRAGRSGRSSIRFIYIYYCRKAEEKKKTRKKTKKYTRIKIYFLFSDCRRVLDCAHDDECSFKLTSAEARRSADDGIARRMRGRDGKRKKNRDKNTAAAPRTLVHTLQRSTRHIARAYRRRSIIVLPGNTNTILGLCATTRPRVTGWVLLKSILTRQETGV